MSISLNSLSDTLIEKSRERDSSKPNLMETFDKSLTSILIKDKKTTPLIPLLIYMTPFNRFNYY